MCYIILYYSSRILLVTTILTTLFFTVLYIDVPPFSEVVLSDFTMQYETLDETDEYPSGGTSNFESKSPEFFDQLKRWTLVFLDDKRHQVKEQVLYVNTWRILMYDSDTHLNLLVYCREA